ncbi:MAG: hypothetical protein KIT09_02615 [Bryobacteraceae bacterium]|nr:hypothetical protein [Bryobacteraceae bacterium]
MTAREIARALNGRKSGAGWSARCPAHDDRSPSLTLAERDGRLLVHCFGGCAQAAVIEALRQRGLWPEPERRDFSPAERRQWAEDQAARRLDEREAKCFGIALGALAEESLERLAWNAPERATYTRLRRIARTGFGLLDEYRDWRYREPTFTAGMVKAGRRAERRRRAQLEALISTWGADAAA